MVNFTDLKFYDSTGSLGGAIDTGDVVQTATPNNLFVNFERSQVISGTTKYKCFFIKNESAEDMENFKIWLSSGTPLDYTTIQMGFDSQANPFDGTVGFDGVNDYVDCTNDATLWSKSLTNFSFAVWIYPTAAGDGNNRYIVNHGDISNQGFRLMVDATYNNKVKFQIKDSGGTLYIASSTDLTLNEWNHIACSYDSTLGSDNIRVYVNGVLGSTTANLTSAINLSDTLQIGGNTNHFKGYIRDFKFWDDSSINTVEAEELYENNEIERETESYHLQFGERTGTTTKDAVSKIKLATLNGGAFWKLNAQTISDTFESPDVYNNTWYDPSVIPKTFKLKPDQYTPIWVKLTITPDATATPVLDDFGIFTIRFDITSTGTSSGGTPGSGGGTGGEKPTSSNYKIAFSGDWGNTGDTSDVIGLMKNQDYDLIVGVGDNAYDDSSASSWCNKFSSFRDKMESAWGNHEYEEDGGTSPYKNFFGYSRSYHSHRFQNCLILILDSNDDKSGVDLDAQRTWAKGELEKYKNDAKVVWRIAVMHHPWFGSGAKHEENEFNQVQKFHKLFTDYDVNFIYTGHNHHWMRSHQCSYNSGDPTDPNIVDSSSPYTRSGNGIIHIVSGTGGHDGPGDFYSLSDSDSFWAYRNKDHNGVHELVASNGGNTLTGRFRNTDNDTFDTFTITA